jgi:hypothetical protein
MKYKKILKWGLIILGACTALYFGIVGLIYMSNVHCVAWESSPTGKRCVKRESYVSICTSVGTNGTITTRACTKTRCVETVPCSRCIQREHRDAAPAEVSRPPDAC